jgi:hypothetical protein
MAAIPTHQILLRIDAPCCGFEGAVDHGRPIAATAVRPETNVAAVLETAGDDCGIALRLGDDGRFDVAPSAIGGNAPGNFQLTMLQIISPQRSCNRPTTLVSSVFLRATKSLIPLP